MKEEFFSKFKDYNKELEKILEKKDFSKDVKNLLLSMFYKLEISYNDYSIVKINSKSKKEYLENILENIRNCNSIEVIKSKDDYIKTAIDNKLYEVDIKFKKIKVIENELALLSALLELNDFQIHLKEEYNLIRNSMPYLLNMAYDMENVEVLRDFNAWSWNSLVPEIKNININLIYQNLKIALGYDIFEKIRNSNTDIDVMQEIEEVLRKTYDKKEIEEFIELIFKISILIYIKISDNERKRLSEEKETLDIELTQIKNKKLYIEKISDEKKELTYKLKQIDLTISNKELLFEEYEKRNSKLSEFNKIFSISDLEEKMQRERTKIVKKIELCNKKISPQEYIENKNKLQKDFDILKDIDFKDDKNNIYKYIKKLQKIFVKNIFKNKIERAITKEEMINCMYELRYYNFLPYTKEILIKDEKDFAEDIEELKNILIQKMYDKKIINIFSNNAKNNINIVKNIFDLKIINMEDIYIQIKKQDKEYIIKAYDEKETLETEFKTNLEFNKKDKIKLNKKIKLFI